jgi:hypothetical protein
MPLLKPSQPEAPVRDHPTIGYNEPTQNTVASGRGKQGCLCLNRNYYSLKCCQGYLGQQGVGLIYGREVSPVTYSNS